MCFVDRRLFLGPMAPKLAVDLESAAPGGWGSCDELLTELVRALQVDCLVHDAVMSGVLPSVTTSDHEAGWRRPQARHRPCGRVLEGEVVSSLPDLTRVRVLVVDDDVTVSDVLTLYLQRAGFAVDRAGDGFTALASAAASPPDLVVSRSHAAGNLRAGGVPAATADE